MVWDYNADARRFTVRFPPHAECEDIGMNWEELLGEVPCHSSTSERARIAIGARPPANPHAEAWIRQGDAGALNKGDLYTARLTLDVTPALRARIKIAAFGQGVTVAELLRGLLEREFPDKRLENPP